MAKMIQVGKKQRREDNTLESKDGYTATASRVFTKGWYELVVHFNRAFKKRLRITHAIAEAVIEDQNGRDTRNFDDYERHEGEGSDDDSADSNLVNVPRSKEDLNRRIRITNNKRTALHFLLEHQQKYVVRDKIMSPLGNKLPEEESKWMETTIMRKAGFKPGTHNKAGFKSFGAFLDHLQTMQGRCIFHRAFLLWLFVHGEEGAMFWNRACNLYRLDDEEAQKCLDMSKALNAPEYDDEYIRRHIDSMILGQDDVRRQRIHHINGTDWDFTQQLCKVHKHLFHHGERTCLQIAELLQDTSMRMGELRKGEYGDNPTEWILYTVMSLIPKTNRLDYTAMSSMVKALAKTYRETSDRIIKVTGTRGKELAIPSHMSKWDSEGHALFVNAGTILGSCKSMNIIIDSYKTQENTPRNLPPGVPPGRGKP